MRVIPNLPANAGQTKHLKHEGSQQPSAATKKETIISTQRTRKERREDSLTRFVGDLRIKTRRSGQAAKQPPILARLNPRRPDTRVSIIPRAAPRHP
jgi:hypothetical protein